MKLQPLKSCSCRQCRSTPSKIRGFHRRAEHKKYRRATKRAIRNGQPEPAAMSCPALG